MDLEGVKRIGIAAAYKAGDALCSRYGRIAHIAKKLEKKEILTTNDNIHQEMLELLEKDCE